MLVDKRSLPSKCFGVLLLSVVFYMFFASLANGFSGDGETEVDVGSHSFQHMDIVKRSSRNQRSTRGSRAISDTKEAIARFKLMEEELKAEESEFVNREIEKMNSSANYTLHQQKIRDSLLALIDYLEFPDDDVRNLFIEKAADLVTSIRVLIDGLLGESNFGPDILAVIRDAVKCHGQHFRQHVNNFIWKLVLTGYYVHVEYQRITKEPQSSSFNEYIETSQNKWKKRLNDLAIECQADEKNVSDEMRNIMNAKKTQDRKNVADSLLKFLEEKYDTKKWIVIVHKNSSKTLDSVWTGGLHHASTEVNAAFAISVDQYTGNFTENLNPIKKLFDEFRFPLALSIGWYCFDSFKVEEYLHRHLIPILARNSELEIETIVSSNVEREDFIFIGSYGVKSIGLTRSLPGGHPCHKRVLIIVKPKKKMSCNQSLSSTPHLINPIECSYDPINATKNYGPLRNLWHNSSRDCDDAMVIPKCHFINGSRPLRNEFSKLFLSVVENYGRQQWWSNRPTLFWKFVDGLLKNDNGKCLAGKGWYVQEVNCDRIGNNGRWTHNEKRQIISKDGYCLSDGGDENGYVVYYDYCKDEPRQWWQ